MLHLRNLVQRHKTRLAARAALPVMSEDAMTMSDRGSPDWSRGISYLFTAVSSLSLLSVAILAVFLTDLVAMEGNRILAWLLGAAGIVPVLGALVMDMAHARALSGYRENRMANDRAARAAIGVLAALVLTMVHPLLAIGLAAGAVLGWLGLRGLHRFARKEPLWDFRPSEAVSILAGRDAYGHHLAETESDGYALWPSFRQTAIWTGVVITLAVSSWLAAKEIISVAAIGGVTLIALWSITAICDHAAGRLARQTRVSRVATSVEARPPLDDLTPEQQAGLLIRNLSVEDRSGRRLLSDIHVEIPPGTIMGVRGEAGAGKSIFLAALSDPHGMAGLSVRGFASLNDRDLWARRAEHEQVPCVHLPETPILLPASGAENLSCFHDGNLLDRGKRILEQLVFATDTVDEICATPDARLLPSTQRKSLAFARAFLLNPGLYLMDRPEDSASDKVIRALTARMIQEKRLGRSFIVATDDRTILECCDQLLVLQGGRVIEAGDAQEIRGRMSSGWTRMVAARSLESEDNLDRWIRSHFKRDGDEANRRKAALIASELLAFSCQSRSALEGQSVTFEFKHFEGHCILKLLDDDGPVTTAQLERAREEVEQQVTGSRQSPLAMVIGQSMSVEAVMEGTQRAVIAKIATYDPRKGGNQQGNVDADQTL
ncbi:ATP-binding cassette domain-containing protein [Pseudaestuariivita atlantica]|uniref:ABC transporter domain-containing protein n=1 Tax=Pseudaestuariivita atlantica TaxID=1317121 RepID=A0A0L1JNS8_9RHOB|nr:ATP-binding cassette domain-containing protein [Pseudaestuariivita atlantica]KNG93414.1 hypothetical protein ATO11_13395 [Pseudaestuariivita atlantica]